MRPLIIIGIFVFLWQAIVSLFHFPPYILPSPYRVWLSLSQTYPVILHHALPTLFEAISGFLLGSLMGMMAALLLYACSPLRRFLLPFLITSQAIPAFALAPLLVIWFGYGASSKIATCILVLFFPVTSAFYDGLQRLPSVYLDLAQTMKATRFNALLRLSIPYALPSLASGLRLAAVFAPMGAMIGEWVGSSEGLGFLLLNANAQMKIDFLFAVLVFIVALTLLFYFIIDRTLRYFISWE